VTPSQAECPQSPAILPESGAYGNGTPGKHDREHASQQNRGNLTGTKWQNDGAGRSYGRLDRILARAGQDSIESLGRA